MKFTPLLRKWRRATASASSKKVGGCSQPSASCFRKKISSASASGGIIFPFTRMRSENSTRWGEVNRPVTYPCALARASIMAQVEPFPLVPATWTTVASVRSASAAASSFPVLSSPSLIPKNWVEKSQSRAADTFMGGILPREGSRSIPVWKGASIKYRRERTRQTRTSYRCYLSVLAGFASRASTGFPAAQTVN